MSFRNGITNREEAYWFGFIIGDGNLARDRNRITVALQERDINQLHKLKAFFEVGNIRPFQDGYYIYQLENKRIANNLRKLGLVPCKTSTISKDLIPDIYPFDFSRGILDADGSIFLNLPFTILRWHGTQSLMEGIRSLVETQSIFKTLPKIQEDNGSFSWGVGGRLKTEKLSKLIWNNPPVYLDRKYVSIKELWAYNKSHPPLRYRLSKDDIREIFDLYKRGYKQFEIAKLKQVSNSHICRILRGERYKR